MFGLDEILTHSLTYAMGEDEGRAKAREEDNNHWHTGEPTEEGWYLIQTEDGDFMAVEKNEHGLWFVDSFGCSKVNLESIVAWQKIEPYKED